MIKALALDYGNVISEPQDESCYARMAALSGLEPAFFMRAFWKYRPDFDAGRIRGREMYRDVLAEAGLSGDGARLDALADALLEEDMSSWARVSMPVTAWALSIKAAGYKLGVLSNMPFDFLERYGAGIRLFKEADAAVFSCDHGLIKPDPALYRILVGKLGCEPEEIVFFDDVQANVEGARAAGIKALLWKGLENAQRDWEGALVAGREGARRG
jgi:putative hydrolase of the HAD superfamily